MPVLPSPILALLILIVSFLYSSAGFGGSSGYLAVMGLYKIPPDLMISTSLLLNIIVAGISFIYFHRAGHVSKRLIFPFLLTSAPAAFLGGYIKLHADVYFFLLYTLLIFIMLRMLFSKPKHTSEIDDIRPFPLWLALTSGAAIGLISGMIGIGGGIFLSPLIILSHIGTPHQASATSAGFIVLNSFTGLLGRIAGGNFLVGAFGLALLPIAILGALTGSYIGARKLPSLWIRRILGVVLLIAIASFFISRLRG